MSCSIGSQFGKDVGSPGLVIMDYGFQKDLVTFGAISKIVRLLQLLFLPGMWSFE